MVTTTYTKGLKFVGNYNDSGKNVATIDYDNTDIALERRVFNIETYDKLRKKPEIWSLIRPVNEFLGTLDKDEYQYLVRLYVQAKRALTYINHRSELIQAVQFIDELVMKTFKRLELSRRMYEYVTSDPGINVPDLVSAGTRIQDTPEMTFYEPDYHQLHTIIAIAKMLFPIFGEIIYKVKFAEDADNNVKEIMAFGIMNTMLKTDFPDIINKLQHYIETIVNSTMRKDDPMLAFRGLTTTGLAHDRLAKTIVKSGVNFDLYEEDGNIMRYLTMTIKNSIKPEASGSKVSYQARHVPDYGEDDDRKVSMMENEAHSLKERLDIPIIVSLSIDQFIESYISQNEIRREVFDQALAYYRLTTIPPTPLNELVVAMFIADPIGSAYSVKYMDMHMMTKIVILIQIYAVRMGFGELVPLLSMGTGVKKQEIDDSDNHMLINEGRGTDPTNYYINLKGSVAHLDDFKMFGIEEYLLGKPQKNIEGILQFLVSYVHPYNVAPGIEALGNFGETYDDDGVVKYGKNVFNELNRFLYHLLITDPSRRMI